MKWGTIERAVMEVNPVALSASLRELAMITFSTPLEQNKERGDRAVAKAIHTQSLAKK